MKMRKKIENAMAATLLTAACAYSAGASAEDTTAAARDGSDATLGEVTITGSRIKAPNMESTSPIQVVTAKEIELQGKTDIIDVINNLPQNFQNSKVDFSNTTNALSTPGGFTTADLRGAGPQRTLVLVNGRRLGVADSNTSNPNPAPDLDQIPAALVDHIEVVTGGASATYGSDAIAGVVNFIMKRNFEGFQIDAQVATYQHDNSNKYIRGLASDAGMEVPTGNSFDGQNISVSMIGGTNIADGRGNVTAYLTYLKADPITGSDRDFTGCQLFLDTLSTAVCGGSANSNYFRVTGQQAEYSVVGDQFLPYPHEGSSPPPAFNSNRYVYMSRADVRYTAGFMGHIDMNDHVAPYFEFGFMNDKTDAVVAPSGLFRDSNPFGRNNEYDINCSNPLLSAQQAAILCTPAEIAADLANPGSVSANVRIGRRNIEGGGRDSYFEHTNYRGVIGVDGEITDAWSYDAYGQYYYTSLFNANQNYLNLQSISAALQVTGTAANPVCISGGSCVPYNIFKEGGVTPDQLAYLYSPGTAYGTVTQKTLHADFTGDLGQYHWQLPWATDGVRINIGVEHRVESLGFDPDAGELAGNLAGFSGASAPIHASVTVKEAFTELRVPLVQKRAGFEDLVFDTGYRYSDYSTAGGVHAYKFELQYVPMRDFRFRASYQRAIRAPNIIDLYNPQTYGQSTVIPVDPCAVQPNGDPATASFEECACSGVTAAEYGNGGSTNFIPQCTANQCGSVQGGNPLLGPEQADTYTFGVTFTPERWHNLTGSIDYYKISLDDAVTSVPQPYSLSQCLATGDPQFCNLVVRTSTGALTGASVATGGYVIGTNQNIGAAMLSGIDVQGAYRMTLPRNLGSLTFELNGAKLLHTTATPAPGLPTYDCVGLYGNICGTLNPKWRHTLRMSWDKSANLLLSAQWRYIGSVGLESNTNDPTLGNGQTDLFNGRLPGMSYLDLSGVWTIREGLSMRFGINNVFDKNPPLVTTELSATGSPNTYPTYDILGRQGFIAVSAKF